MVSLNKVIIQGRVGGDPDVREKMASFSVATTEYWKDRTTGELKDRTEWHRVVSFNPHINKIVADRVRKGTEVYVEGQNHTRKYTDQAGNERQVSEVTLQAFKGELKVGKQPDAGSNHQQPANAPTGTATQESQADPSPSPDHIPF